MSPSLPIEELREAFARALAEGPVVVTSPTGSGKSTMVMSATLEGERVASYLGGRHLHAAGRLHPVEIRHLGAAPLLPDVRGLEDRVRAALAELADDGGDVLVFLPGKAEIASCARALRGADADVLELHGGLTLAEQSRAFRCRGFAVKIEHRGTLKTLRERD